MSKTKISSIFDEFNGEFPVIFLKNRNIANIAQKLLFIHEHQHELEYIYDFDYERDRNCTHAHTFTHNKKDIFQNRKYLQYQERMKMNEIKAWSEHYCYNTMKYNSIHERACA